MRVLKTKISTQLQHLQSADSGHLIPGSGAKKVYPKFWWDMQAAPHQTQPMI